MAPILHEETLCGRQGTPPRIGKGILKTEKSLISTPTLWHSTFEEIIHPGDWLTCLYALHPR